MSEVIRMLIKNKSKGGIDLKQYFIELTILRPFGVSSRFGRSAIIDDGFVIALESKMYSFGNQ